MFPMRCSAAAWIAVIIVLTLPSPVLAEAISRAEVEDYLAGVEQALRDRDMGAVAEALAPSVVLRFQVRSSHGSEEVVVLDRDGYMRSIAAVLGSVEDYQFRVTVDEITIEQQGARARVRLTVRERLVWPHREQHSTTTEVVVVERVDGRLRATEIHGKVMIEEGLIEVHLGDLGALLRRQWERLAACDLPASGGALRF